MISIALPPEQVAQIAHSAYNGLMTVRGGFPIDWAVLSTTHKNALIQKVVTLFDNPNTSVTQRHSNWVVDMTEEGWVFGQVEDMAAQTHPDLLDWNLLPEEVRTRELLIDAVARVLLNLPQAITSEFSTTLKANEPNLDPRVPDHLQPVSTSADAEDGNPQPAR